MYTFEIYENARNLGLLIFKGKDLIYAGLEYDIMSEVSFDICALYTGDNPKEWKPNLADDLSLEGIRRKIKKSNMLLIANEQKINYKDLRRRGLDEFYYHYNMQAEETTTKLKKAVKTYGWPVQEK